MLDVEGVEKTVECAEHMHTQSQVISTICFWKLGQVLPSFFFSSHLLSSPFYHLSLLVVTQIRGRIAGSSLPIPTTVRALHFFREKISAISCPVDSRRIVLTHARRSQQLILFLFLQINSKSRHGGIRTVHNNKRSSASIATLRRFTISMQPLLVRTQPGHML